MESACGDQLAATCQFKRLSSNAQWQVPAFLMASGSKSLRCRLDAQHDGHHRWWKSCSYTTKNLTNAICLGWSCVKKSMDSKNDLRVSVGSVSSGKSFVMTCSRQG